MNQYKQDLLIKILAIIVIAMLTIKSISWLFEVLNK